MAYNPLAGNFTMCVSLEVLGRPFSPHPRQQAITHPAGIIIVAVQFIPQGFIFQAGPNHQDRRDQGRGNNAHHESSQDGVAQNDMSAPA